MPLKPNQSYNCSFSTRSPAGTGAVNADTLPSPTARLNGVVDAGFALTVTNLGTGKYRISGTVPSSYVSGDMVQIEVSATIGTVTENLTLDSFTIDSSRVSDVAAQIGVGGANLTAIGDTRMTRLDAAISTVGTLVANAILVTPTNKIFTNASNQVSVGVLGATAIQSMWEISEGTVFAAGSLGAKFKAWVLGTDGRALLSANAHTSGATITGVSGAVTVGTMNANSITGNSLAVDAITKIQAGLAVPGSAMTLTPATITAVGAAVELELQNDATGGAFMQAVANKLAQEFDIENLTVAQIAATTRDYILDRVLAGNHDIAGTPGKLLQTAATATSVSNVGTTLGNQITGLNNLSSTQVASAVQTGLTAQGYTTARAGFLDTLNGIVNNVKTAIEGGTLGTLLAAIKAKTDIIRTSVATTEDVQPVVNLNVAPTLTNEEKAQLDAVAATAAKHETMIETVEGANRYKATALAQAPTGGGGPGGGATADQIWNHAKAEELLEQVATIFAPFSVLPPGVGVIIVEAPVSPNPDLVPVLFDPRQSGITKMPSDVKIMFADQAPLVVGHSNEFTDAVVLVENFAQDTDGNSYWGAWMYKSAKVAQLRGKGQGAYYLDSDELGCNRNTAMFKVVDLEENQTAHFVGDLMRKYREALAAT